MPFLLGLKAATKELLGDSSLEDWASFLENSPGGTMRPLFRASLLERIGAAFRRRPVLHAACIFWIVYLVVLVFGYILLTQSVIPAKASKAKSTAASLLESDLGIWTARRLYCSASQPCDAWSPFSEDAPFNLRLEMPEPEAELIPC